MAYNEPRILGTANQIQVTQSTPGQTLSIAAPMLIPTQPSFQANCSGDILNVTGDGTNYGLVCDTKIFDLATNYSTVTGQFTAPVAGRYFFEATITLSGLLAGHTSGLFTFVCTAATYNGSEINPVNIGNAGVVTVSYTLITQLAANDTVQPFIQISGSTKVVDVSAGSISTNWGGALIC